MATSITIDERSGSYDKVLKAASWWGEKEQRSAAWGLRHMVEGSQRYARAMAEMAERSAAKESKS